jgi:endonuclease/exonuclease/phosphatase family metal-dependent hydrolase
VLVRTWNLFHGNTVPPGRRAHLDEMVRRATADDPDVLCVQEVPAWALARFTVGDVAARPLLGATLGRLLTAPNHGLIRSAFAGQGNAILLAGRLRLLDHRVLELNPPSLRPPGAPRERRIAQLVRLERPDGGTVTLSNVHCTSSGDKSIPDAEVLRAARWVVDAAPSGDPVVLAGDFNVWGDASPAVAELTGPEWGFSAALEGLDQVLVRGAPSAPPRRLPDDWRGCDGRLLSDHAPVEVEIG